MKCRDARELVNAYIDNGIDPAVDTQLQEHLAQCDKCRAELQFLISWNSTVKGVKPVKAPAGFMAELRRRLEVERRHPLKRYIDKLNEFRNSIRFPVEAAALLVIGSILFTLYRPDRFILYRVTVPAAGTVESVPYNSRSEDTAREKPGRIYLEKGKHETGDAELERDAGDSADTGKTDDVADMIKQSDETEAENDFQSTKDVAEEKSVSDADKKELQSESRKEKSKDTAEKSPGAIFRKYNAIIVAHEKRNNGYDLYTVEAGNSNVEALLAELRRNYQVTEKSRAISGERTKLVLEIKTR